MALVLTARPLFGALLGSTANLTPADALYNVRVDVVWPTSAASTEDINRP
jgi:hypothetical protein